LKLPSWEPFEKGRRNRGFGERKELRKRTTMEDKEREREYVKE
jgi:hypothetical protein